jgi:peptidoglycan/LPS O-acetylase OafA/YrhL
MYTNIMDSNNLPANRISTSQAEAAKPDSGRIKWFSTVRVLGLFLVLAYHLFYNRMTSGFFGVDVFFTFSGYLITALVIAQIHKKGSFKLFEFYKRRFMRIFVPLFLAVAFTLPLALLISPDFLVGIGKQIASTLGFTSNYYEIALGGDYEAQLLPHLYLHTWSLSVEMHFYLIWGLVCALVFILVRAFSKGNTQLRFAMYKAFLFLVSIAAAAGSFLFMRHSYNTSGNLSAVYFDTLSRLFPFFLGAAAACIWGTEPSHKKKREAGSALNAILVTGLIILAGLAITAMIILATKFKFEDEAVWHYGFLLISLLTVTLIFCTRALHNLTPARVKEPKILTATADLSYNIYLYHWPLYIIFSGLILNNILASLATVAVSVIMSAIVFYKIEPIFGRKKELNPQKQSRQRAVNAAVLAVVCSLVVACGFVIQKAPSITSIEADFNANQSAQDVLDIFYLKNGFELLNESPLDYAENGTSLKANLLPKEPPKEETPETPVTKPTKPTEPTKPTKPTEPVKPPGTVSVGGVTVIGDSVALGAQTKIKNTVMDCYVDAKVSRQMGAGYDVMMSLQKKGTLREYVVIALGTNQNNNYKKLIQKFIDDLEPGHKLIFVTPFDGRSGDTGGAGKTAIYERTLPSQYSYITIADWNAAIRDKVGLLASDKVHMNGQSSMNLYAQCIADAVSAASKKPAK